MSDRVVVTAESRDASFEVFSHAISHLLVVHQQCDQDQETTTRPDGHASCDKLVEL